MADDGKLHADINGLRASSKKLIQLGDSTDKAVASGSGVENLVPNTVLGANLAGFATNGPLSRIPAATADAGHTLAGRFYVLGELVNTVASRYETKDVEAARAIDAAGDLNTPDRGR